MKMNEVIRKYRREAGLTQEQVANYLGVTAPAVNKWESGISCPDVMTLAPLARVLGINVDTLLSFEEELSPLEINRMIAELMMLGQKEDIDKLFAKGEALMKTYPSCDMLTMSVLHTLHMFLDIQKTSNTETEKMEKKIFDWYELMTKSKDPTVATLAKSTLINKYTAQEKYEKAQQILDEIPPVLYDKRLAQAILYSRQGRREDACGIYESLLYQGAAQIQSVLMELMGKSLKEKHLEEAEKYAHILKESAKLFELGTYHEVISDFYIALAKQDKETALNTMELMMDSLDSLGVNTDSFLYAHIQKTEDNRENTLQLFRYIFQQAFENDEELALLKNEERFRKLIDRLKQE